MQERCGEIRWDSFVRGNRDREFLASISGVRPAEARCSRNRAGTGDRFDRQCRRGVLAMSDPKSETSGEVRLESWEASALDHAEPVTDHFNEQAAGENDVDAADTGSATDSTTDSATDQGAASSMTSKPSPTKPPCTIRWSRRRRRRRATMVRPTMDPACEVPRRRIRSMLALVRVTPGCVSASIAQRTLGTWPNMGCPCPVE